jgi:hypothetical protein
MSEKQINIAIAEACGWKQVEGEECFFDNAQRLFLKQSENGKKINEC